MYPAFETLKNQINGRRWGFTIFRCTYGDDASWNRFIAYLQAKFRIGLEGEGAEDMYEQLDWDVQEDAALESADEELVKMRFKEWLEQHKGDNSIISTRRHACIMIDREVLDRLDSIYDDMDIEEYDDQGFCWVHLISKRKGEKPTRIGVDLLIPEAYVGIELWGWESVEIQEGEEVTTRIKVV